MKCKIQIDWVRYTLEFTTQEMQAIITWMGWHILDTFDEMTKEDLTELYRLEHEIQGVYGRSNPMLEHKAWFLAHVIHQENAHTRLKKPEQNRELKAHNAPRSRCIICESNPTTDPESLLCADCMVETVEANIDIIVGE